MLITTNPLSAQWMDGGNTFTAPGGCVKAQFGTLTSDCDIQFISSGIERMRLTSNGNFGIGTTTPMRIFHVNGNIRFENLPMDTRSTAIMIDANGDLSTRVLSIDNWNTAFAWGNHAGLYRPVDWVPDWTDVTNKPTFATVAFSGSYNDLIELPSLNIADWNTAFAWGDHAGLYRPVDWVPDWTDITNKPTFASVAISGSYNDLIDLPTLNISDWNDAYTWGNHDTVGYLVEEFDPQWLADSVNYYTKSNLQVDGQSQVHYGNLTNVPTDLSDFTDETNLLFDGDWSSLSGDAPDLEIFSNNAGYITSPDDADADTTNELQSLSTSETALTLSNGGGEVSLSALNYWTKDETNDDLHYEHGNVGIGITTPQNRLHIHSDARTTPDDNVDEVSEGFSISTRSGINRPSPTAITALQITNAESGTSQNDGLQFRLSNNNAVIYHREAGDLTLLNNISGNRLQLAENGSLSIGTHTQSHLFISESGNVGVGTDSPETSFEVHNGALNISGGQSLGQDNARFVINTEDSHAHRLMELRNNQQSEILVVNGDGKVGIGTGNPVYKLDVCGTIRSKEWIVEEFSCMPDFVFQPDYELMPLDKRKQLIFENSHMPYLLSEEDMKENGVPVFKTMQGIIQNTEEIYLYLFEMDERLKKLEKENETLKEKNEQLKQKIHSVKN